jgi:thiol-disulfide isomerase/thioredoxin
MSADFFTTFDLELVNTENFDAVLASEKFRNKIVCVFFWGKDCPNCEVAKKVLVDRKVETKSFDIQWLHANIYDDFELANRFGLFGIPVFMFFYNSRKLGKISPFPGFEPFSEAILKLIEQHQK